jgi:phosphatidylinositol glycan class B
MFTFGKSNVAQSIDKPIFLILCTGFIVQLISSYQAIGYWHPDQHFSVIEFASYKLGITPENLLAWEYPNKVRPTIQVYMFILFSHLLKILNIENGYTVLSILRILLGMLNFILFNYLILKHFGKDRRIILYSILIIANFSWSFPYVRTLFNSEIMASLVFFGAIALYEYFGKNNLSPTKILFIGFLFSCAFFIRFQIAFAFIGFIIWTLFYQKIGIKMILILNTGFLLGILLNFLLDSYYYDELTFTPLTYFKINLIDGRASATGTEPVWYYLGILSGVLTAPPLSIFLFLLMLWGFYRNFGSVYSLIALIFIFAHFLVPHKEERFLFPIWNIMPLIVGYGLRDLLQNHGDRLKKKWYKVALISIVPTSFVFNIILLLLTFIIPVCQSVSFYRNINHYFREEGKISMVYYQRTAFETPAVKNVHFYYKYFQNSNIVDEKIMSRDEILDLIEKGHENMYFGSTFGRVIEDFPQLEKNSEAIIASSKVLYKINCWLLEKNLPVIPEIWVVYKLKEEEKGSAANSLSAIQ